MGIFKAIYEAQQEAYGLDNPFEASTPESLEAQDVYEREQEARAQIESFASIYPQAA